jgi:hypothetical protein
MIENKVLPKGIAGWAKTMYFIRAPTDAGSGGSAVLRTASQVESSERSLKRHRLIALLSLTFAVFSVLACTVVVLTPKASAQTECSDSTKGIATPALVVGFMGGFVHSDDLRHSEVQIARQIERTYGDRVQVRMFENREKAEARRFVLDWSGRGKREKRPNRGPSDPPIILFGHSWGASAVVSLARELEQQGIPISLTIQVDSVRKKGENDSVIPSNVAEAINFYQPDGMLHGRSTITAADPSRTRILGNFRFQYEKEPTECRPYPWYDRLLFKGHTAIECDPRVWSQIEAMIKVRLPEVLPAPTQAVIATRVP